MYLVLVQSYEYSDPSSLMRAAMVETLNEARTIAAQFEEEFKPKQRVGAFTYDVSVYGIHEDRSTYPVL